MTLALIILAMLAIVFLVSWKLGMLVLLFLPLALYKKRRDL